MSVLLPPKDHLLANIVKNVSQGLASWGKAQGSGSHRVPSAGLRSHRPTPAFSFHMEEEPATVVEDFTVGRHRASEILDNSGQSDQNGSWGKEQIYGL